MASYSNTTYSNSLYDLNGVYFNSTSQSNSSSAVDLDALDTRYLIKSSGGTISNNLIVAGSVDIQTSLTLPTIGNVETTIQGKHPTINDGDLTIARTEGLQSSLDAKQDTISNLEVNGNVNLNTSGTNFDTIVVRRPSNTTGLTDDYVIDLNELQIWVNNANILVENADSLISSVVSWSNKDIDLGSQLSPPNLYNGFIENGDGVLTLDPSPTDITIIIKNIPTTKETIFTQSKYLIKQVPH